MELDKTSESGKVHEEQSLATQMGGSYLSGYTSMCGVWRSSIFPKVNGVMKAPER